MQIRVTIERLDGDNEVVRKAMTTIDADAEDDGVRLDSKSLGLVIGEAIEMFAYPRIDEVVANAICVCGLGSRNLVVSEKTIAALFDSASQIVNEWDDYDGEMDDMVGMMQQPSDS